MWEYLNLITFIIDLIFLVSRSCESGIEMLKLIESNQLTDTILFNPWRFFVLLISSALLFMESGTTIGANSSPMLMNSGS